MANFYPDTNILDSNLRKVINRGFMPDGSDHWMSNTLRLYDAAMRAFSTPAVTEIFIGGRTMIEGEMLNIVIGINRDGDVRTMTREAYERFIM